VPARELGYGDDDDDVIKADVRATQKAKSGGNRKILPGMTLRVDDLQ
jgi:hypothetical protein